MGAGECSARGRSEEEVMLPTGQRGARMAEMQVLSGEFRAMKGLEVEGRGLEHGGNGGSLPTRTQRGEGRVESLSFSNSSSICNPLTGSFLFRQTLGDVEWTW